jgi:hypothetical protein
MSKAKENNPAENAEFGTGPENPGEQARAGEGENAAVNSADPNTPPDNPDGQGNAGSGGKPDGKENAGTETLPVEEHAKAQNIPASVFAAVMQAQGWAAGKKVTAEDFKKAVGAFLNAPIGGVKTSEGEKQ